MIFVCIQLQLLYFFSNLSDLRNLIQSNQHGLKAIGVFVSNEIINGYKTLALNNLFM